MLEYEQSYNDSLIQRLRSELFRDFRGVALPLPIMLRNTVASRCSDLLCCSFLLPDELLSVHLTASVTLCSSFQRAMCPWILDPVERQAVMANDAAKCIQEEYPVIIEIACANSPAELVSVKKAHHALYKRSLEEDVAAHATGNLRSV